MSVGTDPRYGRLADRVLSAWSVPASGRVDVKRAILAQWQCEQPANAWPPTLNNPAFVTLGALHSWGLDLGATCGRQYPSFCLARFPTPEDGADAYAGGVLRGSRYGAALAAARAGNGLSFLSAITSAGWGTRYSCCRVAYSGLGGKVTSVTSGATTDATLASYPVAGAKDVLGPFLTSIGRTLTDPIRDQDVNPWLQYLQKLGLVPGGSPNSNPLLGAVYNATKALVGQPWSSLGASYLQAAGHEDPFGLTAAVNGLIAGVGDVLRNAVLLVFILVLLLVGLYLLATAQDRPGPALAGVPL